MANPIVAGTVNLWLATHANAVRQMVTLSTRLRIGPRSRSNNTRKAKPMASPPSYYDLHPDPPLAEGTGRMVTTTNLSAIDRDALERALAIALASDEPGCREQIESKLRDDDWLDAAETAAYAVSVACWG